MQYVRGDSFTMHLKVAENSKRTLCDRLAEKFPFIVWPEQRSAFKVCKECNAVYEEA